MKTKPQPHDSRFGPKSFLENKNFPLDPVKTYSLLSFLGIHVVYDISRNPGDRVVKLEVLCTQCRVPSYEPLRMDKVYKVILPSFLVSGGDGFRMIKDEMIKHDSGKHKRLFPSLTQRYPRTEQIPRGEQPTMTPGGQSQKPDLPLHCQLPPTLFGNSLA